MKLLLRPLLLAALVLSAQVAVATPQSDANYIARRYLTPAALDHLRRVLKEPLVEVYFRSLSEQGVKIVDMDRFIDLIPDEDIAPLLDHHQPHIANLYLSNYTAEQLAEMAELLRADPDTSMMEIHSENLHRTGATISTLGDVDDDVKDTFIHESVALSVGALYVFGYRRQDVSQINPEPDNPVTIAALEADGILSFANPVQRQGLLRQYSVPEEIDGPRFVRPPSELAD